MAVMDRAPALSPTSYRRITSVALWSLVVIVVTGAGVRLTGSGLGCSSWPGCEPGQFVPHGESSWNPWIEFANRMITGAVSVAVALAVLGSLRRVPRRRDLTLLSWGLVAGVLAQIVLGAVVVRMHVHPITVQGHFLVSAVLVANAVVLHHRASRPDGDDGRPERAYALAGPAVVRLGRATIAMAAAVMLAGTVVTGTGPHAGDEEAERLEWLSVRGVAMIHSAVTWVFLAVLVALLVRMRREMVGPTGMERATALLTVVVLQGGLGYLQYATGVPELLVGLHVLGSMLVWAATLRLYLTLTEPLPARLPPLGSAALDPSAAVPAGG
ncbi:heme A synthase [Iamia sp. SCSIO 61187]|nr:heme A synthase [Iamia sp. SCSIO 61187]